MTYYDRRIVWAAKIGKDDKIVELLSTEAWGDYNTGPLEKWFGTSGVTQKIDGKVVERLEHVIMIPEKYWAEKEILGGHYKPVKNVMMCGFNSLTYYCSNILGVGLDQLYDKDFYRDHPLTEAQGLAFKNTPRVLQEVIDPYGLKITGIRVQPGWKLEDSLADYAEVLGINPLARQDRNTTNASFAEQMGVDLEDVNRQFAFEYHTVPFRPGILYSESHASYLSPRTKLYSKEVFMSLIVGRADWPYPEKAPKYDTQMPEEVEAEKKFEVDFFQVRRNYENDKGIGYQNTDAYSGAKQPAGFQQGPKGAPVPQYRGGTTTGTNSKVKQCRLCDTFSATIGNPATFCLVCWQFFWDAFSCGICNLDFKHMKSHPKWKGVDTVYNELICECPTCMKESVVPQAEDEFVKMFITAYKGTPTKPLKEKWNRFLKVGLSARMGSRRGDNIQDDDSAAAERAATDLASGSN